MNDKIDISLQDSGSLMSYICPNCNSSVDVDDVCQLCRRPRILSDLAYLNEIENLVQSLVTAAFTEKLLNDDYSTSLKDSEFQMLLLNLAVTVKHFHYPGDGCINED
jgi:hypothetical protein